jgi:hypothetical protein
MKLEELRQRLREPDYVQGAPKPRAGKNRHGKRRKRAPKDEFGISFTLKTKDGPVKGRMYRCKKCLKYFVPDPSLPSVPSVCANCDSYV